MLDKNVDFMRKTDGEEVGNSTLSTQQNKNFVELEGGKNGVNGLNASFWLILLRLAQLLADSHNCVIQFTRFRSPYEFPN